MLPYKNLKLKLLDKKFYSSFDKLRMSGEGA